MNVVQPKPDEVELVGRWVFENGKVVADDTAKRIDVLVRDWLESVSQACGGWERLLRDPSDGRFWEITYPMSEMQGGGPPTLRVISDNVACSKYRIEI
jgi:Immunity protein 27